MKEEKVRDVKVNLSSMKVIRKKVEGEAKC